MQVDEMLKRRACVGSLNLQTKSRNVGMERQSEIDDHNCSKVKQCRAEHT